MIPVDDPADLPRVVLTLRKAYRRTRWEVVKAASERLKRDASGMSSQFCDWEVGRKVPYLTSLRDYLDAHGLRLALIADDETQLSGWCPARRRDALSSRCAILVGHAGAHRTYAGEDFR